jgi:hypothetical protein
MIPLDINFTSSESIPALEGPSNVQARAYPGVIQVSWDVVKNAKSYMVYRRTYRDETDTQQADYQNQYLGDTTNGCYNNVVSFKNQLQDGLEYEYTIIANSGQSTNRAISDTDLVLNGQSKSPRLRTNIPTRE